MPDKFKLVKLKVKIEELGFSLKPDIKHGSCWNLIDTATGGIIYHKQMLLKVIAYLHGVEYERKRRNAR